MGSTVGQLLDHNLTINIAEMGNSGRRLETN